MKKVGSSSEQMISCSKLFGDKGQMFIVPSSMYTIDYENEVIFGDIAFKHLEILMTPSSETHSEGDWALLLEHQKDNDEVMEK